jgi:hypothetical protein
MNGIENKSSETFIEQYANTPIIARIPHFASIDKQSVAICAAQIKQSLLQYISNAKY